MPMEILVLDVVQVQQSGGFNEFIVSFPSSCYWIAYDNSVFTSYQIDHTLSQIMNDNIHMDSKILMSVNIRSVVDMSENRDDMNKEKPTWSTERLLLHEFSACECWGKTCLSKLTCGGWNCSDSYVFCFCVFPFILLCTNK